MITGLFLTQLEDVVRLDEWQSQWTPKNLFPFPLLRKSLVTATRRLSDSLLKSASKPGWLRERGLPREKSLENTYGLNRNPGVRANPSNLFSLETGLIGPYCLVRGEEVFQHFPTAKSTRNSGTEARDLLTILQKLCGGSSQGTCCGVYLAFFSALLCRCAAIAWRCAHE